MTYFNSFFLHKYTPWNTKDYYILLDPIKPYIFQLVVINICSR